MARLFDDAARQYLEYAGAIVAAPPFTMACWTKIDTFTVSFPMLVIKAPGVTGEYHYHGLLYRATGSIEARSYESKTAASATCATLCTLDVWQHLCGTWSATDSRSIYLNGTSKATDTTSIAPSGINYTQIGARHDREPPDSFVSGHIAFPCIWNAALTDDEVASLADGLWPGLVRPESIVALWPLTGAATEPDIVGGYGMTPYNSPTKSDNPRIYMPPRRRITYSIPASVGLYRRIGLDGGMSDLTAGLRG